MGDRSRIEWTDATWNPVRGCSIVSEGCANCYAMWQAARTAGPGGAYEGLVRKTAKGPRWTGEVRFVDHVLDQPLRWIRPRRIFVNSMSDLFHENLSDRDIARIFRIMYVADRHTFQVLTKRPERMRDWVTRWCDGIGIEMAPPHIWLGTSAENQETADERIPILLDTSAAVRWVSLEPLLGPIDFYGCGSHGSEDGDPAVFSVLTGFDGGTEPIPALDWVVVGGESGAHARPMRPEWATRIRDDCVRASVPFFFKQWGEWIEFVDNGPPLEPHIVYVGPDGAVRLGDPETDDDMCMGRVGRWAGRILDGRTWDEYPTSKNALETV